jgi:hypothetical protein
MKVSENTCCQKIGKRTMEVVNEKNQKKILTGGKATSKNKRLPYNIPSFISVYDWAGQLVHSQDGKGYLDDPRDYNDAENAKTKEVT